MSELVLFTLNAIVIYLIADRIVRLIERQRGGVMKQRQAVFFVIFLVLALISFRLLRTLLGEPGGA
jgi:hypothetical protein